MNDAPQIDLPRARAAADALQNEWGLQDATAAFDAHRWKSEYAGLPQLHLEDVTGIPFLDDIKGITQYQHRARVRAGAGDLFAAGTAPLPGYEEYCRDHLAIGDPDFIQTDAIDPMAVALACAEPAVLASLQDRARDAGGLVIHPYMAIESVWSLAEAISASAGAEAFVLGPPPPVLWVANDKSRLSRLVEEVLSDEWIVETHQSTDPETLADHLAALAKKSPFVGMKRTRCASAMGNVVFDSPDILGLDEAERRALVDEFLTRTRWCPGEAVLVVEWRDTDLSPSTQTWIPPLGDGPPILDGVYEQILEGPEKVFVGSRPSTLPKAVNRSLGQASLQVAAALQQMGYVGRCSFDFIVTGDVQGDFHVQFTECNGRWGGTSTPMHLVDRLISSKGGRPAYIATDYYLPESHHGLSFQQFTDALGDELFDPKRQTGRFILYNVGPLSDLGKFDVISIGEDPVDARLGLDEVLPDRLGF